MSQAIEMALRNGESLYLGYSPVRGVQIEPRDFLYGIPRNERIIGGILAGAGILTALFADEILEKAF